MSKNNILGFEEKETLEGAGGGSSDKTRVKGVINVDLNIDSDLKPSQTVSNSSLRMDLLTIVIGATLLMILGLVMYIATHLITNKNPSGDL
jgi:hypothetical protein